MKYLGFHSTHKVLTFAVTANSGMLITERKNKWWKIPPNVLPYWNDNLWNMYKLMITSGHIYYVQLRALSWAVISVLWEIGQIVWPACPDQLHQKWSPCKFWSSPSITFYQQLSSPVQQLHLILDSAAWSTLKITLPHSGKSAQLKEHCMSDPCMPIAHTSYSWSI